MIAILKTGKGNYGNSETLLKAEDILILDNDNSSGSNEEVAECLEEVENIKATLESNARRIIREISFTASQQVKIQHEQHETVTELLICDDIDVLEYSADKGAAWENAQEATEFSADSETLWRVSSYKNGMTGNVILKSNIIVE